MSPAGTPAAEPAAGVLIKVAELERHYTLGETEVRAVDGVSLEISAGDSVAILGPSGSGKSTLMHLLGALDHPSAGSIEVEGEPVGEFSLADAAKYRNRNIGFVFQAFHLQSHLTALENVTLPLKLGGMGRAARRARAAEMLTLVGLGDRMSHRPNELSGGQQQRVSIARALANRPKLLLADEPTGNLDSGTGREVIALFERLRAEHGLTIVLVTHDPEVAARMGRVIRMRDGKVVSDERAKDATPAAMPMAPLDGLGRGPRVIDDIRDVWRGISRQRARAVLTAFGIAIGGMAIALMVGLGIGLHDFILVQAESINDPLSLWVVNSDFNVSDLIGNRAQQLGKPPQRLEEKTLQKISRARGGFRAFSDARIEQIRAIPGVVDVRPRSYVIMDGVRLMAEGAPRLDERQPTARDRKGGVGQFEQDFYVGYTLVRAEGAKFRIEAGRSFVAGDRRVVILSYQYAEVWGLTPAQLIGREVEVIFPELGGLSEMTWVKPQKVEVRYGGYRAKVVGVVRKSILSSCVFMPPRFGEEVTAFQFATPGGAAAAMDGGQMAVVRQLLSLSELAADEDLRASLSQGTPAERELAEALGALAKLQAVERVPGKAPGLEAMVPLFLKLASLRTLLADEALVASLKSGGPARRRLYVLTVGLLGLEDAELAEAKAQADRWGSRIRVRVADQKALPAVKRELVRMGMSVRTLQDSLAMVGKVFAVIDAFLSSFGLIALIVAGLGIANTLIMAVMERTREIGVMKAVGATEGYIRRLFALEALLIGLLGGVVGIVLALLCGALINGKGVEWLAPDWAGFRFFDAPLPLLLGTVAFCGLIGLVAGLYPAHRAARLDPIEALRSE